MSVLSVVCIGNSLGIGMPSVRVLRADPGDQHRHRGAGGAERLGHRRERSTSSLFAQYGAGYMQGVQRPSPRRRWDTRGVALSVLYRLHLTSGRCSVGVFVLFEKDKVTRADIEREVEDSKSRRTTPSGRSAP
jgi:hypothetical protein